MSNDDYTKHQVTTDALDTLGSILDGPQGRDAIHLAVEQVIAGQRLIPGQHVSLSADGTTAVGAEIGKGVGIVDPFIEKLVEQGDSFWLVVYPRQITTLRHVWEHPNFKPSGETAVPSLVGEKSKAEAEKWLRDWADEYVYDSDDHYYDPGYGDTFETLIERMLDSDDEYLLIRGRDANGNIDPEVWQKLAIYTGTPVRTDGPTYFSCSC